MNVFRRIMTQIMTAAMLISCLSASIPHAVAQTTDDAEQLVSASYHMVPEAELPENEVLYGQYVERLFYGSYSVSLLGELARDQLGPEGQSLYDYFKVFLLGVAAGEQASTSISLTPEQLSGWNVECSIAAGSSDEALADFLDQLETEKVMRALLHDCPYDLYWYDKVTGIKISAKLSVESDIYTLSSVTFKFAVSGNYRVWDYDPDAPACNTEMALPAIAAANNAKAIVAEYEGNTDYEKLSGYQNRICELVSYDSATALSGDFSADSGPWQMICVFDGDPATKAVCEGYSKAFQYLCDLSAFSGDVSCYTVSGTISSSYASGGHMWNIVAIGSDHYLADITNCDTDTAGQDGGLFLVGDLPGKTSTGYTGELDDGYTFCGILYRYNSSTTSLWGTGPDSILWLSTSDFVPASGETCQSHNYVEVVTEPTCVDKGHTTYTCSLCKNEYTDNYTDATGIHSYEAVSTTEPTCTQKGCTLFRCSVCGDKYTGDFTGPTDAHSYVGVVTEPTCADKGHTTYTCSLCKNEYTDNYTDATGIHSYEAVSTTEPTCTQKGCTLFRCSVCGDEYTGDFTGPADVHSYRGNTDPDCELCGFIRAIPMHRLYNQYTQEHLYTSTSAEAELLSAAGWTYEGIAWHAPNAGMLVYRLYNPFDDWHFYTLSLEEIDTLTPLGWQLDGVMCCSASSDEGVPVYRLFNPYEQKNYHHYTASAEEISMLVSLGWKLEGIAWYSAF